MSDSNPSTNATHVPLNGDGTTTSQDKEPKLAASPRVGDEQALESHEVIELQAFIDRKAWIEEKIKILEKMPPIEVFVGLEDVRNSALEVSGLPTRVELQQWLVNHDAIEKETEIFDAGEMKKLKKFTKAAAQRNLSPEDTDLIEITLTTIFDLDKLMHLLRDRSEHLDLLDVRLTWEEHRIAAWTEIHTISRETEGFIKTRARWSPTVYDSLSLVEEAPFDPIRRGSIVSTSSAASVNSESSINSVGFSRNARFKFSEQLSKDASKIVSSINILKHGKLGYSGKALDKLIDASRKPVPDELLDEQDKLEEKGIHGLERLGHFAANLVAQWKKADEVYVETMKDKTSLLNLMEEVETARLRHPHTAQSQLFITRLDKLKRRLGLRDLPESARNSFPRPVHPLFPDQGAFNDNLTQTLSQELRSTLELLRSVTVIVEGYSASANVVQGAEILSKSVDDCASSLTSIMDQLVHGVPVGVNGSDGSPPSLLTERSINPTGHSAFFALLPSLLSSLEQLSQRTDQLSAEWAIISLQLEQCGIDTAFRTNIASQVQKLCELRGQGWAAAETINDRSEKLRQTREVCSCIDALLQDVDSLHDQVLQDVERHQWRKVSQYSAPLTPPTPSASLGPSLSSPADFPVLIQQLQDRCLAQVETPLGHLSSSHGDALANWISQKSTRLQASLATVTHLSGLLKAVQSQAQVMQSVRAELDSLLLQIEDLSAQQTSRVQDILEDRLSHVEDETSDTTFKDDVQSVKSTVQTFLSELTTRVPFVSHDSSRHSLRADSIAEVPSPRSFDTIALDAAVRAECNTYAMRVSGEMEALQQASNHVHLARLAKRVDAALSTTFTSINDALSQSTTIKQSLPSVNNEHTLPSLQLALQQVEDLTAGTSLSILRSFSPAQDLIRQMDTVPTALDPTIYKKIYLPRRRAVDDAELRFTSWKESLEALKLTILHAQSVETKRLQKEQVEQERIQKERDEQLRLAEEIRLQAEQKQAIAEAAEVERLRREREEEEERSQLEEARRILKRERERFAIDSAENFRIEQEHRATIQRLRDEEARLREVHDKQVAEGRLAVEEVNKSRREHERQASLKIKQIQEELRAEEERLRLKKERIAEEMLRTDRSANTANKTQFVINDDDVFGSNASSSTEFNELQLAISALRKRLRALSISKFTRVNVALPSLEQVAKLEKEYSAICQEATAFPPSVPVQVVDLELKSLREDLELTSGLLAKVQRLSTFTSMLHKCDAALSDLLEHIDSYPSLPLGLLSSEYQSPTNIPPETQMEQRLTFTRGIVQGLQNDTTSSSDSRVVSEQQRIMQTWNELEDMAKERLHGRKSRPPSVISAAHGGSGRTSRTSIADTVALPKVSSLTKKGSYGGLSASGPPPGKSRYLSPTVSTSRRAVSGGSTDTHPRSASRLSSVSSSRSVSGPHSSLYAPTFASRQRTNSLSTSASTTTPTLRSTQRARAQTNQASRTSSPALSDARSVRPSRSSIGGTWSRAPRLSLNQAVPTPPPKKSQSKPRKAYVPDPKSKLDVAVGDVVNNLPVDINIEGVAETWRDQSGKYWIGDQDPKLCFCRILRSHTVMVRVGGGWSELSKFIRDHFAESFRLMPESPPRPGAAPPEKWISSATLLETAEAVEAADSPPAPPRTPEPKFPFVPSFALSTPSAKSPQSIRSSPSTKGSPLTPMQFIRRADYDAPLLRPTTPSKSTHAKRSMPPTPARHAVWRP